MKGKISIVAVDSVELLSSVVEYHGRWQCISSTRYRKTQINLKKIQYFPNVLPLEIYAGAAWSSDGSRTAHSQA
jgi:hypothetical protein